MPNSIKLKQPSISPTTKSKLQFSDHKQQCEWRSETESTVTGSLTNSFRNPWMSKRVRLLSVLRKYLAPQVNDPGSNPGERQQCSVFRFWEFWQPESESASTTMEQWVLVYRTGQQSVRKANDPCSIPWWNPWYFQQNDHHRLLVLTDHSWPIW